MVPISSVRISRVPTYSGLRSRLQNFVYRSFTFFALPFQVIRLSIRLLSRGPYPTVIMTVVWAPPISLATTFGITIVFFSSGYLDVSVPRVPLILLSNQWMITRCYSCWVPSFGYLRISGYLLLPAAFRSLSRPSSAPCTKASSCMLFVAWSFSQNCTFAIPSNLLTFPWLYSTTFSDWFPTLSLFVLTFR